MTATRQSCDESGVLLSPNLKKSPLNFNFNLLTWRLCGNRETLENGV
jgi:hypothetical protein